MCAEAGKARRAARVCAGEQKCLINLPSFQFWVHLLEDTKGPPQARAFVCSVLPHKNVNNHVLGLLAEERFLACAIT
jgi:hypothetical protein